MDMFAIFCTYTGHAIGRDSILEENIIIPLSELFDDKEDIARKNSHKAIEMVAETPPGNFYKYNKYKIYCRILLAFIGAIYATYLIRAETNAKNLIWIWGTQNPIRIRIFALYLCVDMMGCIFVWTDRNMRYYHSWWF